MVREARLTPKMIARLLGIPVGGGPKREDSMEDSPPEIGDIGQPVGDPLTELEERNRVKGSNTTPSGTIVLVAIGMMMVAVGALLIFPISLSLEHARVIGGLGFFVVGVSVIFSAATRALS